MIVLTTLCIFRLLRLVQLFLLVGEKIKFEQLYQMKRVLFVWFR